MSEIDMRKIKPFKYDGKQIPALHDLKRNAHKLAAFGFFKPDKFRFNMVDYPAWVKAFKAVNNNGAKSRAWDYLIKGQSGVFAQGTKKLSFQPCIFASFDEPLNRVQVVRTFMSNGTEWAEIKTLNVHDAPPTRDMLLAYRLLGFAHKYIQIGRKGKLGIAPKDKGNVFIFIVSDGTRLYIETDKLMSI